MIIKDYLDQKETNLETSEVKPIDLPKSDVLQFFLIDGSKVTVRPSGTEPKIKFYFGARTQLASLDAFRATDAALDAKIKAIIRDMGAA